MESIATNWLGGLPNEKDCCSHSTTRSNLIYSNTLTFAKWLVSTSIEGFAVRWNIWNDLNEMLGITSR